MSKMKILVIFCYFQGLGTCLEGNIKFQQNALFCEDEIQSNLYKMTTLGTTQKWSSWTGGRLIKNLCKTTSNKIWSFLTGFWLLISL